MIILSAYKIMAYLTFTSDRFRIVTFIMTCMNGTNQNQSLGKSELRYYFIRLTICIQPLYEHALSIIQSAGNH